MLNREPVRGLSMHPHLSHFTFHTHVAHLPGIPRFASIPSNPKSRKDFPMSDPIIPTPQDTQLLLQDTVTKAASFNSAGKDLGSGYAPGGLGQPAAAVVQVSAMDTADGNETYVFVLQES